MELWLWVVNGVMWIVAAGLIGVGIRKLLIGVRWIRLASVELMKYHMSESIQDYVRMEKAAEELKQRIQKQKQRLLELKTKAAAVKTKALAEKFERRIRTLEKGVEQDERQAIKVAESAKEDRIESVTLKRQIEESGDILLSEAAAQIVKTFATGETALAAAFFAMASVLVGGSAVLIALFMA
jgi:uncharacterized protein (DUF342 family)